MKGSMFLRLLVGLPFLAALALPPSAPACPFCTMQGQTLTGETEQASLVLYGTLKNPKQSGDDAFPEGSTDLEIETIIKPHDILNGRKTVTLNRYLDLQARGTYKFLVFCDVYKGKIDAYRGIPVKVNSDMPRYLKGAAELKNAATDKRLRFFFDFLDNGDIEISNDAYKEFGNADYKDFKAMATGLPVDRVVGWLNNPATPQFRLGLYASMLGHSGKKEHAPILRELLEDPDKRVSSGIDGILAGYVLLQPKDGWDYLRKILGDSKKEFMLRYNGLRAVRFFWEFRSDVIPTKDMAEAAALLLSQKDIADLAVEDLRKWKYWDLTDQVLALQNQEAFKLPIVRRAVLRYCLRCPKPEAVAYVTAIRTKDAKGVEEAEELLRLEEAPPPPPANTKK